MFTVERLNNITKGLDTNHWNGGRLEVTMNALQGMRQRSSQPTTYCVTVPTVGEPGQRIVARRKKEVGGAESGRTMKGRYERARTRRTTAQGTRPSPTSVRVCPKFDFCAHARRVACFSPPPTAYSSPSSSPSLCDLFTTRALLVRCVFCPH